MHSKEAQYDWGQPLSVVHKLNQEEENLNPLCRREDSIIESKQSTREAGSRVQRQVSWDVTTEQHRQGSGGSHVVVSLISHNGGSIHRAVIDM